MQETLVSFDSEKQRRWVYCDFLKVAGMKLKVPQLTIATAAVFCHRYFATEKRQGLDVEFDPVVRLLFSAGKVEETPKPLSELAHTLHTLQNRKHLSFTEDSVTQQDSQDRLRERILRAERILLHHLGFDFNVEHPYKHLLCVIKSMNQAGLIEEESTRELAQVSWNFANDSLRTTLCLEYDAKHTAEAVVYLGILLATKFLSSKFELPQGWWEAVNVNSHVSDTIGNRILDLYEQSGSVDLIGFHTERSVK